MEKTRHRFLTDSGEEMNAHFEVHDGELVLCSRGGAKGSRTEQNTDYSHALILLLKRIEKSELSIAGIWVDSARVQNISMEERLIFHDEDLERSPAELRTELSKRMATVGRSPKSRSWGNPTKRLRFAFAGNASYNRIKHIASRGDSDDPKKPYIESIAVDSHTIQPEKFPVDTEERVWAEGNPKRVNHLRRERDPRAIRAKKNAYIRQYGRLSCEQCGMVPEQVYGSNGDACIEVHHKRPLSDVSSARGTKLEDLMCVCANCHRILHHELRNTNR